MSNETKPQPYARIRLGVIHAAIWRNVNEQNRVNYSVSLEKRYTDADGEWKSTTSFQRDDLLILEKAASLAFERIHEAQANDKAHANATKEAVSSR